MQMAIRRALLVIIVTILCGVVFHAPLSVWLGTLLPEWQVEIKAWKEVLLVLATLLTIIEVSRRRLWRVLSRDWAMRLGLGYMVLHVVLLAFMWQGVQPAVAGLMIDLRFVLFFMVVYAACRLYPMWRRPLLWGSFVAAAFSLLFAVLQVTVLPNDVLTHLGYGKDTIASYLTVDQNEDFVRINGTLRGPNPLGVYGVIVAALCLAALVTMRKQVGKSRRLLVGDTWDISVVAVMALVAVWFSYSRSAWIALVVAIGIVLIVRYGRRISKVTWVAMAFGVLLISGGLYLARDTSFVSHVIIHEDPTEGNDVNSNDGHLESLIDGSERMARQPLGAGIGSTGSPSLMGDQPLIIENQYLYIAHEAGWLGLGLFVALSVVVLRRLWQRRADWLALGLLASGLGAAVACLFLPVWADDTVSLVWWGLAGVALGAPLIQKRRGHARAVK